MLPRAHAAHCTSRWALLLDSYPSMQSAEPRQQSRAGGPTLRGSAGDPLDIDR